MSDRALLTIAAAVVGLYVLATTGPNQGTGNLDSPDGSDVAAGIIGTIAGIGTMSATTYSDAGLQFVQTQEGKSLTAYPDARGYSIGYGHFGASPGETIDDATAENLLATDMLRCSNAVNNLVIVPLTQSMFDALTSFAYNVGIGPRGFPGSTLLRTLNTGNYAGAANQFWRWNQSDGKIDPQLTARRQRESDLFLSDGMPG